MVVAGIVVMTCMLGCSRGREASEGSRQAEIERSIVQGAPSARADQSENDVAAGRAAAHWADCHPEPRRAADRDGARSRTDLARLVAAAIECAKRPPYDGRGRGGSRLVFDKYVSLRPPTGSASGWIVQLAEESPRARPYGLELAIDANAERCAGNPVEARALPTASVDADAVIGCARACAAGGRGVGGSALRFDAPTIGYEGPARPWSVSFPESSPTTAPSGLDVGVAPDASRCGLLPMD